MSATVAVAGGLVASIAAPQAANAATTGVASISGASSVDFAAQGARTQAVAHPLATTRAQHQLTTVAAHTELASTVTARPYVAPKPVVRPQVSSVSRTTTTTSPAQSTQPTTQPTTPTPPATNPTPTPAPASGIVAIAERFVGVPYVYGGSTPAGFDCSGFTQYVYSLAGQSIPRTATAQMFAATSVSSPQPGDLIFFGSSSYAYHVAIYIGNGMMIDANHPGGTVGIRPIYAGVVGYGRI
ncbi:C40 family peptidase [Flexivirga caeni]|uniref:C40 family peptidase n=1 Tax=Flexivirga caeni TaxID=2294115 RepID=UPI0013155C25|nr:C40 family peptidase [Flexivirga caeni]